jgi:hypothetical protein
MLLVLPQVDIMPTLVDLAGVGVLDRCVTEEMSQDAVNCTEGRSLKDVVMGPSSADGSEDGSSSNECVRNA